MRSAGLFCLMIAIWPGSGVFSQDVVLVRVDDQKTPITRKGQILDWRGSALTLLVNGRERRIDNGEIIQVQSAWQPDYLRGKEALSRHRYGEAVALLSAALQEEGRLWAQLMIRGQLVEALLADQNPQAAVEQFMAILREDPQTRFYASIPLTWAGNEFERGVAVPFAKGLLESTDPSTQLLGASWLLTDPAEGQRASNVIATLIRDVEPRIAQLAAAQSWRPLTLNPTRAQWETWQSQAERFRPELKFGAAYVIAEAAARLGEPDRAALHYMQLPILHPQQRGLVPLALYKCARLLQNEDPNAARQARMELQEQYPNSFWARQFPDGSPSGQVP